jgi:hypothetical protein
MRFKGITYSLCFLLVTLISIGYAQASQAEKEAATRVARSYYDNWKFNLWNAMIELLADASGETKTQTIAAYSKEKTQLTAYTFKEVKIYSNPQRIIIPVKLKLKQGTTEKEVSDSITLVKMGIEWKVKDQPTYNPGTNLTRKKK